MKVVILYLNVDDGLMLFGCLAMQMFLVIEKWGRCWSFLGRFHAILYTGDGGDLDG